MLISGQIETPPTFARTRGHVQPKSRQFGGKSSLVSNTIMSAFVKFFIVVIVALQCSVCAALPRTDPEVDRKFQKMIPS